MIVNNTSDLDQSIPQLESLTEEEKASLRETYRAISKEKSFLEHERKEFELEKREFYDEKYPNLEFRFEMLFLQVKMIADILGFSLKDKQYILERKDDLAKSYHQKYPHLESRFRLFFQELEMIADILGYSIYLEGQ